MPTSTSINKCTQKLPPNEHYIDPYCGESEMMDVGGEEDGK
jgi:hypothetical protein